MGMCTLRQMMREALAVVDKNWDGELNFEEPRPQILAHPMAF